MANRMEIFDKCVNELLRAVTDDMIHIDNLKTDFRSVTGKKISRNTEKNLESIRKDVLKEFQTEVKSQINEDLKNELKLQECFDEFESVELRQNNAWRINGDPQHDTFAQRRQIYIDYINKLENAEASLEAEVEKLKKDLAK